MMTSASTGSSARPLRLWPGVALLVAQWAARFGLPVVAPETLPYGMLAGMFGFVLIVAWWLFASRAPWRERLGAFALLLAGLGLGLLAVHPSIRGGAMGMLYPMMVLPWLSLVFVAWAVVSRRLEGTARWAALAGAVVLACGSWALLRTGGFDADLDQELAWRWTPTPEEQLLERREAAALEDAERSQASAGGMQEATWQDATWPGFGGPDGTWVVSAPEIATDWATSPPTELWRRAVGPGWSSVAAAGARIYTQEQRGDDEAISCYDARTGELLWMHRDPTRFWESNAGAGPRGTPTLHDGRVYALGATGIVNALDAADGSLIWSRDGAADASPSAPVKTPTWGFSGSPRVVGDTVFVMLSGRLVAYDRATGDPRWLGAELGESYASARFATIEGVDQVLQLGAEGLVGLAAADGTVLWRHDWSGFPIVTPAVTADGGVLLAVERDSGLRRLDVERSDGGGWRVDERWTSRGLKPYLSDVAIWRDHAYGLDGGILACVGLDDGERRWKGGRYGHGQLLLLREQGLLLVLTEDGELVLVEATPEAHRELARHRVFAGKTWNHLALVDDSVLIVRNDREMVALRLPAAQDDGF